MNKFLTACAVIAVVTAAVAILEPALYNATLDAITHFIGWIRR